jgi:hypothetical protein
VTNGISVDGLIGLTKALQARPNFKFTGTENAIRDIEERRKGGDMDTNDYQELSQEDLDEIMRIFDAEILGACEVVDNDPPDHAPITSEAGWYIINGFHVPSDPYESSYTERGDVVKCHCLNEKTNFCRSCEVYREDANFAWRPHVDSETAEISVVDDDRFWDPAFGDGGYDKGDVIDTFDHRAGNPECTCKECIDGALADIAADNAKEKGAAGNNTNTKTVVTKGNQNKKSTTYSSGSYSSHYGDWDGWGYGGKDRHAPGEFIEIMGYTFNVASMANTRKPTDFVPDFGLYFDWGWKPWWNNGHVSWPDMSLPDDWNTALEQIIEVVERVQAGQTVEMGCIGAHGRTGTALAAICVILGMKGEDAVDYVRKAHCKDAIETDEQEWWPEWVEYALGRTDTLRPKPAWGWGSYGVKSKSGHTRAEHYAMWQTGKECTLKDCDYWSMDKAAFGRGEVPGTTTTPASSSNKTVTDPGVKGPQVRVGNYMVPKPGFRESQHAEDARAGCKCDACRYLELGHGAFLRPASGFVNPFTTFTQPWHDKLWLIHDAQVEAKIERKKAVVSGNPVKIREAQAKVDALDNLSEVEKELKAAVLKAEDDKRKAVVEEHINVAQADGTIVKIHLVTGEIIDTVVSDNWKDRPPTKDGKQHGQREGEFVWLSNEGWVWEKLAPVPVDAPADNGLATYAPPKSKRDKKREKKRSKQERRAERQRLASEATHQSKSKSR